MSAENVQQIHPRPLVVAISSRALFDMEQSHAVFEAEGLEAFQRHQLERESEALEPGEAFPLARKLLSLNEGGVQHPGVEVILVSRNSADSGLRIFNTIEHCGLDIQRAVFTNGEPPHIYMEAMGADLFLSTHDEDVRRTLAAGFAAAKVLPGSASRPDSGQLRIAFDGDAVVFSDEAERVYQEQGLDAFSESEKQAAETPLKGGPFKRVLQALHDIQSAYPIEQNPIRTALVTARSAPAHKRVILTLRAWDIRIDEAMFLGGKTKGPFLAAFGADIFFDDQEVHVAAAQEHVATGHVPFGVKNE
jgi:5'-nucleotidase